MSTQFPGANIITDQYPYPFQALKNLILALIASLFGPGASTVVWRPGAVSSGNVFGTWAEVVAAVATLNGAVSIVVDMDAAPAVIPAGAWDLRPAGISGPVTLVAGGKTTAYYLQLVTIANAVVTIHGLTGLDGIQIDNRSTVNVITISAAAAEPEAKQFTLDGYAAIYQSVLAGAGVSFIRVLDANGAISLNDSSFISSLDGGTNAVRVIAGGFLQLYIHGTSVVDTNQLVSPAGLTIVVCTGLAPPGFSSYTTQASAATITPTGLVQKGSNAIVVGTGKTAAIPAFISATSRIFVDLKTPVGDALTVKYAALGADRVTGNTGTFQVSALAAAGGGAVNGVDTSTVDWEVLT